MKISCKQCNKEREVSKAMVRLIERGVCTGKCKSCSVKENFTRVADYDRSLYQTPIYSSWAGMKTRCTNSNVIDFKGYGGRGISYDKRWNKFKNFYEDMSESFKEGLTLDRIDNNKGYSKENCRWSTACEQANNRRSNRVETIDGVTKTLAQWCKNSPVKPSTIRQRFYVYGWSLKDALAINN